MLNTIRKQRDELLKENVLLKEKAADPSKIHELNQQINDLTVQVTRLKSENMELRRDLTTARQQKGKNK